ncbi:MAG: hypothetical protein KZQ95_19500 [Candidatus Thiodiazotropha sp. (ex Epidulcina cf. delphinae)]|nr:hypothetical protein [Candidatus Thiodiazotropha sp. (ex Epidulcina cf. delphinae)]
MIWKIYFFVLLLLYAIYVAAAILYPEVMRLEIVDYIDLGFAMLALLGVFGYAFKKAVLNQSVWKVYLLFIILWDISFTVLRDEWIGGEDLMYEILSLVIMALILIPQYVAIFRYGFRSKQLWAPYNVIRWN